MKLSTIQIHNFRSVIDAAIEAHDYLMLVGANNAGKSTILNALRTFYDDAKWSPADFPKTGAKDTESWVQLKFRLDDSEWVGLAEEYKDSVLDQSLTVRRYFKSDEKIRVQKNQSNIFGFIKGSLSNDLFYGAKNVGTAKVGQIIYVPALTTPTEQTKMSGPSPLRNILNFLLKKAVTKSDAYQEINAAFKKLDLEAHKNNGFLDEISKPINTAIKDWNIKIALSINPVTSEDISKSLVTFTFLDSSLEDAQFDLDRFGNGFQRSVIYELIRLAPSFKEEKNTNKKEFNPTFNLVLFEEPEAFLHPSQQENMAYHLRRLGATEGQQVLITTHSPIFVGKATEQIEQIVRVQRIDGITNIFQPKGDKIKELFGQGTQLSAVLAEFVSDSKVPENQKKEARAMIKDLPQEEIAIQEEEFRFQLWLDSERASLFFADKILLVEGASERGLFNYLLANDWHDLCSNRICVVDVFGKYNFHRYMGLMSVYGIPYGIMLDDDNNKTHQDVVNKLIEKLASVDKNILSKPNKFNGCLEDFLKLPIARKDKKPVEILKAVSCGNINKEILTALRKRFCEVLAIDQD